MKIIILLLVAYLSHQLSYNLTKPFLNQFSFQETVLANNQVVIDIGKNVYPVYKYEIIQEPDTGTMCYARQEQVKKRTHQRFQIKSSEFVSVDMQENVIYALTKDLNILQIENTTKGLVQRVSLYFSQQEETVSSVEPKIYSAKGDLYIAMNEKLYSILKTKQSWSIGPLVLSEAFEIEKHDGKIYGLSKNKIKIIGDGSHDIQLDKTHEYIDFAVEKEFIYIVQSTKNSILKYSTQNSSAVELELGKENPADKIEEIYAKGSSLILQMFIDEKNYLWELFVSPENSILHSNKIIYKYIQQHIQNIFLFDQNIGIIIAQQQIIYFQYGINRNIDAEIVLNSERVRLERHPTLITALNIGDKQIKYLFMMPQSLYLAEIDEKSLVKYQFICDVDTRKSYEEWPSSFTFKNLGLCLDKDPKEHSCQQEQVVEVDYGDHGGHYGVNNKHIKFIFIWFAVLWTIIILSVVCWRLLIRKAAKIKEHEDKKSQALSVLMKEKNAPVELQE